MVCPNCGNNYPDESKFCPNCSKNSINNKKKSFPLRQILIICTLVLIIVICIFVLSYRKRLEVLDNNTPILIKKNGMYGFINNKGKKVIDTKLTYAEDFHGNFTQVCETNKDEDICYIVDNNGNKVMDVESFSSTRYNEDNGYWIINETLYNEKLEKLSQEGIKVEDIIENYGYVFDSDEYVGILDKSGNILYKYDKNGNPDIYFSVSCDLYDKAFPFNYCRINVDNEKYGVININTGKIIIDYISDNYIFNEGYNVFKESKKDFSMVRKMYIQDDKILYETTSEDIEISHYEGRPYINIFDYSKDYGDGYSYIDINTGVITKEEPEYTMEPEVNEWEEYTKYKEFKCNSGTGLKLGEDTVIKCEYSAFENLDLDLYKYLESHNKKYIFGVDNTNSKTYLIDIETGKKIKKFNTTKIETYEDSTFIAYKDGDKIILYNLLSGKSISLSLNTGYVVGPNYIKVNFGKKINYYNANFDVIYTV